MSRLLGKHFNKGDKVTLDKGTTVEQVAFVENQTKRKLYTTVSKGNHSKTYCVMTNRIELYEDTGKA